MRLFNVVLVYDHGTYLPEAKEIIVLKEMPNTYLVVSNFASGHRSRIAKDDAVISLSELGAWDKYITKARQVAATMRREWEGQCENVTHAVIMRNGLAASCRENN